MEKLNDLERGAKIMAPEKAICESPQAVVIISLCLFPLGAWRLVMTVGDGGSSLEGVFTTHGKNTEPARDITENNMKAKEPFLAISPTGSTDPRSSSAFSGFWR